MKIPHLNLPIFRAVQFIRNLVTGKPLVPKEPELDEKRVWDGATPKIQGDNAPQGTDGTGETK